MVNEFALRVGGAVISVNKPDRPALLVDVRQRLRDGVGFAIATLNLDHLVKIRRVAAFREAYQRQDLVVADGHPVVWLSRLAGNPVSLVTGSDLVEPLAAVAAQEDAPVALLGATEETLARARDALVARNPGLRVVACLAPAFGFDPNGAEADRMIEALRDSGARLTFLALGAPKRRKCSPRAAANPAGHGLRPGRRSASTSPPTASVAPNWMRRLALEWLWRVGSNPRRLAGRYALCAMEMPSLALSALRRARRGVRRSFAAPSPPRRCPAQPTPDAG